MIWYRGDRGDGGGDGDGRGWGTWYAASRHYAEFFGPVEQVKLPDDLDVLDLRGLGVGDSSDETYLRVERLAPKLAQRYDAVRVIQWHADYSAEPQDTLLVF